MEDNLTPYKNASAEIRAEIRRYVVDLSVGHNNAYVLSREVAERFDVLWTPEAMYETMRQHGVYLSLARVTYSGTVSGLDNISSFLPNNVPDASTSFDAAAELNKRTVRDEIKELRELKMDEERAGRLRAIFTEQLGVYKPTNYSPMPGLHADPADTSWVLHLSDWHIGQKTDSVSTGGLFYHDKDVATEQVHHMLDVIREILRDGGREMQRLLVVVNGDIVEGDDMRNSQHRGLDMLVAQQTIAAFDILRWLLDGLHEIVKGKVVISNVGGNHDRTSRKAGNAGGGELGYTDSYAWIIGEMLKRWYAESARTTVINWDTFFGRLVFGGHRIVHSHGSDVNWSTGGHSGIPWNAIQVAAGNYAKMLGEFDALLMGHGHIPAQLPLNQRSWVFLNGSLPASTDYIQSRFKAVRRPVQQLLAFNEHGMVAEYPLYLDVGAIATDNVSEVWGEAPHID